MVKAVVIGSTGETGRQIVKQLVESAEFEQVTVIARREIDYEVKEESILKQIIVDDLTCYEKLDSFEGAEYAFSAFGTTRSQAGSGEEFKRLEIRAINGFIDWMKEKKCSYFGLISSIGANSKSHFLYPQVKGIIEDHLISSGINKTIIYRPGFLECERRQKRWGEVIMAFFLPLGNWMFPGQVSISTQDLAKAMVQDAINHKKSGKEEKSPTLIKDNGEILRQLN